jgi:hypothetical protein
MDMTRFFARTLLACASGTIAGSERTMRFGLRMLF